MYLRIALIPVVFCCLISSAQAASLPGPDPSRLPRALKIVYPANATPEEEQAYFNEIITKMQMPQPYAAWHEKLARGTREEILQLVKEGQDPASAYEYAGLWFHPKNPELAIMGSFFPIYTLIGNPRLSLEDRQELFKVFRDHKADFNVHEKGGLTPLAYAAQGDEWVARSKEVTQLLLEFGADANLPESASATPSSASKYPALTLSAMGAPLPDKFKISYPVNATEKEQKAYYDEMVKKMRAPQPYALWHEKLATGSREEILQLIKNGKNPAVAYEYTGIWLHPKDPSYVVTGKFFPIFALISNPHLSFDDRRELLRVFKDHKADLNVRDEYGSTPLIHAAEGEETVVRNNEIIQLLVEFGVDVNSLSKSGKSALYIAVNVLDRALMGQRDPKTYSSLGIKLRPDAIEKGTETVKLLLRLGVNPNLYAPSGRQIDWEDINSLDDHDLPLIEASATQNIPLMRLLLDAGADPNGRNSVGRTALMKGFVNFDAELRRETTALLLERGADPGVQDKGGHAAAHFIAKWGDDPEVMKLLVAKGADINIGNNEGATPLNYATQYNLPEMRKYLRDRGGKFTAFEIPTGNKTPTVQAVLTRDLAALRTIPLDELQKRQARTELNVPITPLHLAAMKNDPEVMSVLFQRKPDWNVHDHFHRTPLHFAVESNSKELVRKLIENGADPNHEATNGKSPFDMAVALNPEMAEYMLGLGVKPEGKKAMFLAIATGNDRLVKALMPFAEKTEKLLRDGAGFGNERLVKYFLAQGIEPKELSEEEWLKSAREQQAAFADYGKNLAAPAIAKPVANTQVQHGTFQHTLSGWAQGEPVPQADEYETPKHKDPANFPISMYVPKSYTGNEPYGLIVFLHGRRSSGNSYPNAAYQKTLDRHRIIWAGYSSYIVDMTASYLGKFSATVARDIQAKYNIDPKRIYMAGISWGGRVTAGYAPIRPDLFSGAIAMGGAFFSGIDPAMSMAKEKMKLVFSAGDYDYNRKETFSGYTSYQTLGYKNVYYLQEPAGGHNILTPALFEQAVQLMGGAVP